MAAAFAGAFLAGLAALGAALLLEVLAAGAGLLAGLFLAAAFFAAAFFTGEAFLAGDGAGAPLLPLVGLGSSALAGEATTVFLAVLENN